MRIWITHRFPAFHKWEKAPKEVAFLRNLHRHMFHVKVWLEVQHEDRELEFFMVKRKLVDFCDGFEGRTIGSCENTADNIKAFMQMEYPKRGIEVEVSEDGESGAIV
jgi:6-pyruvoyl-tetrahydropterin synthase